ncbi:MAG: hypothetical protein ABIR18_08085 [Chitinophagaceae bacterium]
MRYLLTILILLSQLSCGQHNKIATPLSNETACIFSQISYCSNTQEKVNKYLPGWKVVWDATALNGNHAFIANDGGKYVVVIRGSLMEFSWDAFENWIYQDLNIVSQQKWTYTDPSANAKISTGSYRGWQNISTIKDKKSGKDLLSFLLDKSNQKDPIYVTGHSLGGNLATVLASYLSFKFKEAGRSSENINVITFAAPAAGNEGFAKEFDKTFPRSVRIENTEDIVPKFPCTSAVTALGTLYTNSPSATEITVGYKNMTVPLSAAFKGTSLIMSALELQNGFSHFKQTNEKCTLITIKPSGRNTTNDITSWFSEAGYQHGIAQYASTMGAVVVDCK